MKVSILLFAAAVLCSSVLKAGEICAGPNTQTDVCIYSNFGEGQSYLLDTGLTPGYSGAGAVAVAFTPSFSSTLLNIEVAAFRASSQVPDSVHFAVYDASGEGGFPGTLLEGFQLSGFGVANTDPQPGDPVSGSVTTSAAFRVSAASVLHPLLQMGMQYWLVMDGISDSGDFTWNSNSLGRTGAATILAPPFPGDPALWSALPNYSQGAFALDGNPTPEPGTLALLLSALAFVLRPRRRVA